MRRRFRTAPPPYQTKVVLPVELRTLPFAQLRSRAWPKEAFRVEEPIAQDTFFLPGSSFRSTTSDPRGAAMAVLGAKRDLTSLQEAVLAKHLDGASLTPPELEVLLNMRLPERVNYNELKRASARAKGTPVFDQRQIPFDASPNPSPAVRAAMTALRGRR